MMPEPRLRVFPGGGRVTILDLGGSDKPTRFEVEWRNPSAECVQETEAFWDSVHGHVSPWAFEHADTVYEQCHFEADSLKHEAVGRDHRLVVRFWGMKAAHCLICGSKSARLFDLDSSLNLVSIDCPNCGNFRIVATMQPSEFEDQRTDLQAMIKPQPERPVITSNWKLILARWNQPKPNY